METMKSNGYTISINFYVILIFGAICITTNRVNGLDTGTVAPLNSDAPANGDKPNDHNKDLKKLETRFNDPPPEFYKGPSGGNRYDSSYDLKYNGATQRPSNLVASNYYNPYLDKHGFYGANAQNTKDRISIGGGLYSGNDFVGNGYSSDRVRPYGPPQAVDVPNGYSSHGYNGYDGGLDTQGFDYSQNAYGGSGGGGGGGNMWGEKMHHLSKSHLLPLAGAALIGIAAALLVNPVLLQLGTVTGKRRRRRDISQIESPEDKLNAHKLAYNGHHNDTEQ